MYFLTVTTRMHPFDRWHPQVLSLSLFNVKTPEEAIHLFTQHVVTEHLLWTKPGGCDRPKQTPPEAKGIHVDHSVDDAGEEWGKGSRRMQQGPGLAKRQGGQLLWARWSCGHPHGGSCRGEACPGKNFGWRVTWGLQGVGVRADHLGLIGGFMLNLHALGTPTSTQ